MRNGAGGWGWLDCQSGSGHVQQAHPEGWVLVLSNYPDLEPDHDHDLDLDLEPDLDLDLDHSDPTYNAAIISGSWEWR